MVGSLEMVLPDLDAQDITVKDFFVIHLGLSSSRPSTTGLHLHNVQERRNHSAAHPATPFKLEMAASAAKFRAWSEVKAEKAEADEDEDTKTAVLLTSGLVSVKGATCFHCGPSANYKTSVCWKSEDFRKECLKAKCCQKCLDAAWSSSHECSPVCAKCGKTGHVSARHKHHKADMELYKRIRKESRKRKGSSASGPSSDKKSKPAPKEDAKDFKNQLEKARLEGMREGLEKPLFFSELFQARRGPWQRTWKGPRW